MYKLNVPTILEGNQSFVSLALSLVSAQPLKGNSIAKYVGSVPMACLNCPCLKSELNCNQCNRWNQRE